MTRETQKPQLNIPVVTNRYFHELEQTEIDTLIADKKTVGYIMENYKQPDWCNYPEALSMTMGCWSLCDLSKDGLRTKISKDFCKGCDCENKIMKAKRINRLKNRIEVFKWKQFGYKLNPKYETGNY